LSGGIGVEGQSNALGNVVLQVATGELGLEVVEDDGDKRTGEEIDEVIVSADVSASKQAVGACDFGSGSLLRVENLAIVVRTELEGGSSELNVATLHGHKEVLVSADLVELQLEFLCAEVDGSFGRASGLNGKAITWLNGELWACLVHKIDLVAPTFLTNVGLFGLDVQAHQLSLVLVNTNTFVLDNGLPLTTTVTFLLLKNELEVLNRRVEERVPSAKDSTD